MKRSMWTVPFSCSCLQPFATFIFCYGDASLSHSGLVLNLFSILHFFIIICRFFPSKFPEKEIQVKPWKTTEMKVWLFSGKTQKIAEITEMNLSPTTEIWKPLLYVFLFFCCWLIDTLSPRNRPILANWSVRETGIIFRFVLYHSWDLSLVPQVKTTQSLHLVCLRAAFFVGQFWGERSDSLIDGDPAAQDDAVPLAQGYREF
jgi:hypothetical protein